MFSFQLNKIAENDQFYKIVNGKLNGILLSRLIAFQCILLEYCTCILNKIPVIYLSVYLFTKLFYQGPNLYDVHTEGGVGEGIELYHVFLDFIVSKQQIYFSFLRIMVVDQGSKNGSFFCGRHKWMTPHVQKMSHIKYF